AVRVPLKERYFIDAEGDLEAECARLNEIIVRHAIAVAFIGIEENGHLAFNDPPADFETAEPYIVVKLDEACRRQQMGEGWFKKFEDVPTQAISMSIRQIMKSKSIVCTVPDERKAKAVKGAVEGPVTPMVPASILQRHEGAAFGVILVRHGRSVVEVATFRSDGRYLDGRRPSEVRFTTAEEDAQRRDFTINGLFLDPLEGDRVIDYVGGQEDLAARRLRAIGDPSARFAEDHLRLLRAVRFAARFGLEIAPATAMAIEQRAELLKG